MLVWGAGLLYNATPKLVVKNITQTENQIAHIIINSLLSSSASALTYIFFFDYVF